MAKFYSDDEWQKIKDERKIRYEEKQFEKRKQRELLQIKENEKKANKLSISNECFLNYQSNVSLTKTCKKNLKIDLVDLIENKVQPGIAADQNKKEKHNKNNLISGASNCIESKVLSDGEANSLKKNITSDKILINKTECSVVKNETEAITIPNQVEINVKTNIAFKKIKPKLKTAHENPVYSGNNLDSSLPIRSIGKHREVPKEKRKSKLKQAIIKEQSEPKPKDVISYITNIINEELEISVKAFLSEVVTLQEKLFKRDPRKGDLKRRYVVGFHNLKKYLVMKRVKMFVITKDIKIYTKHDILLKTIKELTNFADANSIPYIFALKKRKLGTITLKHLPITCIGLINHDAPNYESFHKLLPLIEDSKNAKAKEDSAIINGEFLQKLKEVMDFK